MAFIKPFRHWIVYPALLRSLERSWVRHQHGEPAKRRAPRLPSSGFVLQCIAVAHAVVGMVTFRRTLASMARAGVLNAVGNDTGERAAAFWFMAAAPLLWSTGRLLQFAEGNGDDESSRNAAVAVTAVAVAGILMMPRSPFWLVAAVAARELRSSSRPPRRPRATTR